MLFIRGFHSCFNSATKPFLDVLANLPFPKGATRNTKPGLKILSPSLLIRC